MNEQKRIIVVDDDISCSLLLKEILSRVKTYSIINCDSAAQALSKIQYEPTPDLVITDLQMPVMNGLELTEIIKEKMPNLPVIITTGRSDLVPEDNPADMVIQKPYRMEEFLEKVGKIL